eukprot:1395980-Prymnesium_polylepis.2
MVNVTKRSRSPSANAERITVDSGSADLKVSISDGAATPIAALVNAKPKAYDAATTRTVHASAFPSASA